MKKHNIQVSLEALNDLNYISDCVLYTSKSKIIAKNYIAGIRLTMNNLANYGDSIAFCQNKTIIDKHGPFVHRVNYKKVAIIYTIEGNDIFILELRFQYSITDL